MEELKNHCQIDKLRKPGTVTILYLMKNLKWSDYFGYGKRMNLKFSTHIIRSCIVYLE